MERRGPHCDNKKMVKRVKEGTKKEKYRNEKPTQTKVKGYFGERKVD